MHKSFEAPKATFRTTVKVIRERMELKEREISGQWMTEERMAKSGEYSKLLRSKACLVHCYKGFLCLFEAFFPRVKFLLVGTSFPPALWLRVRRIQGL